MGRSVREYRKINAWCADENRNMSDIPLTRNTITNIKMMKKIDKTYNNCEWEGNVKKFAIIKTAWDLYYAYKSDTICSSTFCDYMHAENIKPSVVETEKGRLIILTHRKMREWLYNIRHYRFKLVDKQHPKYNSSKAKLLRLSIT